MEFLGIIKSKKRGRILKLIIYIDPYIGLLIPYSKNGLMLEKSKLFKRPRSVITYIRMLVVNKIKLVLDITSIPLVLISMSKIEKTMPINRLDVSGKNWEVIKPVKLNIASIPIIMTIIERIKLIIKPILSPNNLLIFLFNGRSGS